MKFIPKTIVKNKDTVVVFVGSASKKIRRSREDLPEYKEGSIWEDIPYTLNPEKGMLFWIVRIERDNSGEILRLVYWRCRGEAPHRIRFIDAEKTRGISCTADGFPGVRRHYSFQRMRDSNGK